MDIRERDARRKRAKARRQKEIRRNLIFLCVCIAAGVTAAALLVRSFSGQGSAAVQTAGASENGAAEMTEGSGGGGADNGEKDVSQAAEEDAQSSGTGDGAYAAITPQAASGTASSDSTDTVLTPSAADTSLQSAAGAVEGLYDREAGNVTPEELPAKVDETAARHPEFYGGELLPATTALYTDRSADFAAQPGVPCGADPVEGEKVVYLTLDDGPSANTITALNILDHYGIKATFFVTGLNPEYSYLIKEAYDRGHTIGLHTNSHDYAYVYASAENYYADLNAIGAAVQEQIGFVPCFIRFPGGAANYISHDYCEGIMTFLTQDVGNYGYQYFDWNASSGDGAEDRNAAQLADAAISYDYYDTIVLLSHDGSGKEVTMQALPFIIEYYLSKGYQFRPITRNAYTSHHTVEN